MGKREGLGSAKEESGGGVETDEKRDADDDKADRMVLARGKEAERAALQRKKRLLPRETERTVLEDSILLRYLQRKGQHKAES